ncbi:MAG: hypothetical protein AMJ79_01435 [Phycisphaerae bacterium SM23_30]|nr:MAG: hypothetical protein AMJ79_01435 [Phycisphaerae bacterium SM23_30]
MKRCLIICAVVLAAASALALRLPQLALRPMHTDEAVHAVKFGELLEEGRYRYDPYEYHGPTLYYFTLLSAWLSSAENFSEVTEVTLRIIPVIFGVGTVVLLLLLADGLGRGAAIGGALLTAISPAMVFYSRYYIHETLLVFFGFLVIAAAWRYSRSGSTGWLLLAGAGVGLMHATKETCIIAFSAMFAALLIVKILNRVPGQKGPPDKSAIKVKTKPLIAALIAALLVSFTLFSSFFTHLSGPWDSLAAYCAYFHRADTAVGHHHPWYYYLKMLIFTKNDLGPWWSEGLIVILSMAGLCAAVIGKGAAKSNIRLLRFLVFYTLIMTAAYSIIPYKTPWCLLGFWHGMIILAGVGAAALVRMMPFIAGRAAICLLLIAGVAQLTYQSYRVSFRFFDDPRNPYVYAHTISDTVRLAKLIQDTASAHPAGNNIPIKVIAEPDNYWPLPWYFRRFGRVGYWHERPAQIQAPIVIASDSLRPPVEKNLPGAYHYEIFGLRPNVILHVYIQKDLWDAYLKSKRNPR